MNICTCLQTIFLVCMCYVLPLRSDEARDRDYSASHTAETEKLITKDTIEEK